MLKLGPLLLTVAAFLLGACSEPGPYVRVAATVDGKDISVLQLQQLLARVDPRSPQKPDPAQLMDSLIDRELFVQKALRLKLDRRTPVARAIEESKADILSQAYVELVLGQTPPDAREVAAFYSSNATVFEQRRIYRVFELAVIATDDRIPAIKERALHAQNLNEIAAWLKTRGLQFNVGGVTKATEEIAPVLLSHLISMSDGQIQVIKVPGGASIVQLVQSEAAPLSREAAAPIVERALQARKRAEIAAEETKYLRSRASIEYVVDLGRPRPSEQAKAESMAFSMPPMLF